MRKQSVGIALALGLVLIGFQNCSPTFLPEQTMQNDDFQRNIGTSEPEQYEGVDLSPENASAGFSKTATCPASGVKFQWPFGGTAYRDWIIANYVDANTSSPGTADYTGATGGKALTYDGHLGLDIMVPNFRAMDGDFPVFAAADGKVTDVVTGMFDRNVSDANCAGGGTWNVVKIKHSNGIVSIYGHLKKGSPTVVIGQTVVAGQKIGVVGSSGCSWAPHLHFQVVDCNKRILDPVKLGMFITPPVYTKSVPATLMDTVMESPVMSSIDQMKDPGGDPSTLPLNQVSSFGFTMASIRQDDSVTLRFYRPDGSADPTLAKMVAAKGYAFSHWWINFAPGVAGNWQVAYLVNGKEVFRRPFSVQ